MASLQPPHGKPVPARDQSARGLAAILSPASIAVVGASPDPASVGHRLLATIVAGGFKGPVHPIHPTAREVLGRPAHRSVADVPGPLDLAVIAVPAAAVPQVVADCARKGVRGLVVVTAGFREAGPDGAKAEEALGRFVREHGLRLVGPNCLGIINADPAVNLHAVFAHAPAAGGPVALMTQSGALGIALLDRAYALGLGIGRFVSMGNKLDVSGNDLLLHWESDPGVRVIAMHLESVGNPRNFLRIASRVARRKPIVVVKGGRSPEGARAAGSHTGALIESDALVEALIAQAGAVRVATVEELFDACLALSLAPLPAGNRVAVVTNSGGPAILFTDALPSLGLALAKPAAATLDACRARLPSGAAVANPLDMLAGASPATLQACLQDFLRDPGVDAAVALMTPLSSDDLAWVEAILAAQREARGKPLLAILFGRNPASPGMQRLVQAGVPAYSFPENAAHALAVLAAVAAARRRPEPALPVPAQAPHPLRRRTGTGWLSAEESLLALAGLGAAHPAMQAAADPAGARAAAVALGLPVALKVQAPTLVHKSEAGGVRVNLATPEAVQREAALALARVRAAGHTPKDLLVQRMAAEGLEFIVGSVRDPKFGPVLTVGLGGIYAEALRDVATRLAPITPDEADAMLASLRCRPLLDGARGQPPRDIKALRDFLVAFGRFLDEHPDVQEAEVNPLRVLGKGEGLVAVDARIRVAEA